MKNKVYTIDETEYKCPTNISRIASDRTNGWQVRFDRAKEKYTSKLFSDSKFDSIEHALEHATIWCEGQYASMEHLRPEATALASKTIAMPQVIFKSRREGGIPEVSVECYVAYIGHRTAYRSYVGTLNTATKEKLISCLRRAAAIKRAFVAHCVKHKTYEGFDAAYIEENIALWKLQYTWYIDFDSRVEDTFNKISVMKAKRARPECFA